MKTLEEQISDIWGLYQGIRGWTITLATEDYSSAIDKKTKRGTVEHARFRNTREVIEMNISMALLSPSPYVREYARLLILEKEKNENT